jgi:hypothetical protein
MTIKKAAKAKPPTKKRAAKERPVLVTTSHRGVFFGYTTDIGAPDTITLKRARLVLYWPRENRGFMGLATSGPLPGARVGPAAPSIAVRFVTSVSELTDEAVARFEAAPWSS